MPRWLDLVLTHPRKTALVLGVVAATGFQPLGLWPLTLLALAGLFALLHRAPGWKQAALIGWCFGLGHFSLGNNWIATAFTYQANMPAWLGWVAVLLLSLYLAVYPALAAVIGWQARRSSAGLVLTFAAGWIVSEWLRGWVFTGFAWNPLGVAALGGFDRPGLALLLPWLGTYALSGLVIVLAGCWWKAGMRGQRDLRGAALILVPLVAVLAPQAVQPQQELSARRYTLVQPDIRQDVLNDPAWFEWQFQRYASLSRPRPGDGKRLVLWSESGVPDYLRDGYPERYYFDTFGNDPAWARARLARVIGSDAMLLTGTVDLEFKRGQVVGARNAVTVLDGAGTIRGGYAKAHLVPYGEYLALRWLLEPLGVARLVPGGIDFWPGPGPQTLDLGELGAVGVQICYEIIFSGEVVDPRHRPDFLFNPSNDGWFGAWGPPQFLAQTRLRAIEEGLPVLRSTTTGISAVIDGRGVVRQHVPRLVPGRLDGQVPAALAPTLFSRLGNMLPLGWSIVLLVAGMVASRRRKG
ncbi:MAG: apolipoprotein N-acyltransferase [Novosphingobium sp.]